MIIINFMVLYFTIKFSSVHHIPSGFKKFTLSEFRCYFEKKLLKASLWNNIYCMYIIYETLENIKCQNLQIIHSSIWNYFGSHVKVLRLGGRENSSHKFDFKMEPFFKTWLRKDTLFKSLFL